VVDGPGFLGAQAKIRSVVKIWVALEGSRGLARDEDSNFYWIETLENYLHTDPKSGEGTFAQGGDSINNPAIVLKYSSRASLRRWRRLQGRPLPAEEGAARQRPPSNLGIALDNLG
jgi:hypothetical protein